MSWNDFAKTNSDEAMDQQQWDLLDTYFCEQLVPADEALDVALRSSAEAGLPSINVAPNQGKFLQLLARIRGARRIFEIGTFGGYSSIWLARGLQVELINATTSLHTSCFANRSRFFCVPYRAKTELIAGYTPTF